MQFKTNWDWEFTETHNAIWGLIYVWGLIALIGTGAFIFTYIGCLYVGAGRITKVERGNLNYYVEVECETKNGEPFHGYMEMPVGSWRNEWWYRDILHVGEEWEILYPPTAKYQDSTRVRLKVDRVRNFVLVFFIDAGEAYALYLAYRLAKKHAVKDSEIADTKIINDIEINNDTEINDTKLEDNENTDSDQ